MRRFCLTVFMFAGCKKDSPSTPTVPEGPQVAPATSAPTVAMAEVGPRGAVTPLEPGPWHTIADLAHAEEGTSKDRFNPLSFAELRRVMTTVFPKPALRWSEIVKCKEVNIGGRLVYFGFMDSRDSFRRGSVELSQEYLRKLELEKFMSKFAGVESPSVSLTPAFCNYLHYYSDTEQVFTRGEGTYVLLARQSDFARKVAKAAVKALQLLEKMHDSGLAFSGDLELVHLKGGMLDDFDQISPADVSKLTPLVDLTASEARHVKNCKPAHDFSFRAETTPAEDLNDFCPTRFGDMYKLSQWLMAKVGGVHVTPDGTYSKLGVLPDSARGPRAALIFNTFHKAMFEKSSNKLYARPNYDYWIRWFKRMEDVF